MAKSKSVKLEMSCISYVELDTDTVLVSVLEKRTVPGLFRDTVIERQDTYTGLIRDHIWLDGKGQLAGNDQAFELYRIAVNRIAEKRLNDYIRL